MGDGAWAWAWAFFSLVSEATRHEPCARDLALSQETPFKGAPNALPTPARLPHHSCPPHRLRAPLVPLAITRRPAPPRPLAPLASPSSPATSIARSPASLPSAHSHSHPLSPSLPSAQLPTLASTARQNLAGISPESRLPLGAQVSARSHLPPSGPCPRHAILVEYRTSASPPRLAPVRGDEHSPPTAGHPGLRVPECA